MTRTIVTREISAPLDFVFATISEIENYSKAIPHIVNVEFLTDQKVGVGTRFRETRDMNGNKMTTELEVKEYRKNDCVRMVADSNGTIWDTIFEVTPLSSATELKLTMDARAYKLIPRFLNPLIKGMMQKAVEKDMDLVKVYCEQNAPIHET